MLYKKLQWAQLWLRLVHLRFNVGVAFLTWEDCDAPN